MMSLQRPKLLKSPLKKFSGDSQIKHKVFVKETSRGNSISCSCGKCCEHVIRQYLSRDKLIKRGEGFSKRGSVTVHAIKKGPIYMVLHVLPATGEKELKDLRTVKVRKVIEGKYLSLDEAMSAFMADNPTKGEARTTTSPVEELKTLSRDARPAIYEPE